MFVQHKYIFENMRKKDLYRFIQGVTIFMQVTEM